MPTNIARKLFVNLAVRDLKKSMDFFSKLGFGFNLAFTDEKAACMVINEDAYVMLLSDPFFQTFTKKTPCDSATHTEGMFAISCNSRADVDDMVKKAIANGGKQAMEPSDLGFMYNWSFYDLDGHHWEPMWMDPQAAG